MATLEERWDDARVSLDAAIVGTGMTARIHRIKDYECSLTFEKDGQMFTKPNLDIATFEDQPLPKLKSLVAEAKLRLGAS